MSISAFIITVSALMSDCIEQLSEDASSRSPGERTLWEAGESLTIVDHVCRIAHP